MLRFLDKANAVTLLGLSSAISCALLAATGRLAYAVAALIISGLCDLFDGALARMSKRSEEAGRFGARLDSLVDGCSFGFAPTVLLYASGMRSIPEVILLCVFACCAVWRLAYFDVVGMVGEEDGKATHFIGLPTTYVALVLSLGLSVGFVGADELRIAAIACSAALALAMVSPVRIRKPGGAWYAFFALLAIGLLVVYIGLADRFPGE